MALFKIIFMEPLPRIVKRDVDKLLLIILDTC